MMMEKEKKKDDEHDDEREEVGKIKKGLYKRKNVYKGRKKMII